MPILSINWKPSAKWLDDEFISSGKRPASMQVVKLDTVELTAEQRAVLVANNNATMFGVTLCQYEPNNSGRPRAVPIVYDEPPTLDEIFARIAVQPAEQQAAEAESLDMKAALAANYEAAKQQAAERNAQLNRKRDDERRERRAAAAVIEWKDGKAVTNLLDRLLLVADDGADDRFNNWAKRVTGITNEAKPGGYNFDGDYVSGGTSVLNGNDFEALYIVASVSGTRRTQTTTIRLVLMIAGRLERTDAVTDNSVPGWQHRLATPVLEHLAKLAKLDVVSTPEPAPAQITAAEDAAIRAVCTDMIKGVAVWPSGDKFLGCLLDAHFEQIPGSVIWNPVATVAAVYAELAVIAPKLKTVYGPLKDS